MSEPMLQVRNLVKRFGALVATNDLSLNVMAGELHAIIGPNGAGKTTLIGQLCGEITPSSGRIFLGGEDVTNIGVSERARRGMARSFQITSLCPEFSALENVALAVQAQQGHSFRMWGRVQDEEAINAPARELLEKVGLQHRSQIAAGSLAHGEQRQLEMAVALACRPKLLLLDEPMAGMGKDESWAMMSLLKSLKGEYSMLLVEHDMDVVFALADRITVLVYGQQIASGTPGEIAGDAGVREAYLGESGTGHA